MTSPNSAYNHSKNTKAGLRRAVSEGKQLGKPRIAPELEGRIRKALNEPGRPGVRVIAAQLGIAGERCDGARYRPDGRTERRRRTGAFAVL
jgi:hypothetical protein